jgi:hypothetical protein
MKKVSAIIPFLFLFPILVIGQSSAFLDSKCVDYSCNMDKVKSALANKNFKEAIDYCRAAKASPNADNAEVDAITYKILETVVALKKTIEGEKQAALAVQKKALADEKIATEESKKAQSDAATYRQEKESANLIVSRADNDEKKSLEIIRKAENDIEVAKHAIEKAKSGISMAMNDRQKAKDVMGLASSFEKKAVDTQKKSDLETETAKKEQRKASEIIANADKASIVSANLVKEISDLLTGVDKKEEPLYVGSKSVEMPVKKEPIKEAVRESAPVKESNQSGGGIYVNTTPAKPTAPETTANKKVELLKLQKAIDTEKDKTKAYALQSKLIDNLEAWFQKDTSFRSDLAENYANKAWSALFLKKFNESEQACYKGLAIDPNKRFINAIMGHALLFQDNLEAAMRIYQDYVRDARQYKNKSNRQALIEDLDVLKQEGVNHRDLGRVKEALLNNKK